MQHFCVGWDVRVLHDWFTEEGKAGQLAAGAKEEEHTSSTEYLLMFLSVAAAGVGFYMAGRCCW